MRFPIAALSLALLIVVSPLSWGATEHDETALKSQAPVYFDSDVASGRNVNKDGLDDGVAMVSRNGPVRVGDEWDLQISIWESTDPVVAGSGLGNLSYIVTVTNVGSPEVTGGKVDVIPLLPPGVTLDNLTVSGGSWLSPEWSLPDLTAGMSVTMDLELTVSASAPVSEVWLESLITTADQVLVNTDDDYAGEITVVVRSCDLTITKIATVEFTFPGDVYAYYVAVTNEGPSDASNVEMHDILPLGLAFNGSGFCSNFDSLVVCHFGDLEAGGMADAVYSVEVLPIAPAIIINEAIVFSGEPDPDQSNNIASDQTINEFGTLVFRDGFESGDTSYWGGEPG